MLRNCYSRICNISEVSCLYSFSRPRSKTMKGDIKRSHSNLSFKKVLLLFMSCLLFIINQSIYLYKNSKSDILLKINSLPFIPTFPYNLSKTLLKHYLLVIPSETFDNYYVKWNRFFWITFYKKPHLHTESCTIVN